MLWKDINEKQFFSIDPNESVDRLLKVGIHRVFLSFIKVHPRIEARDEAKRSICSALDLLIRVNIPTVPWRLRVEGGPTSGYSFVSRANQAVMQFRHKRTAQGGLEMLRHDITSLSNQQSKQLTTQLAKQRANEKAGNLVERILIDNVSNDMEKMVAKGVLRVLKEAESFAGPFTETFLQHRALFRKLRDIYQITSVDDLVADRGIYSWALATDMDSTDRGRMPEEDDFRFEG